MAVACYITAMRMRPAKLSPLLILSWLACTPAPKPVPAPTTPEPPAPATQPTPAPLPVVQTTMQAVGLDADALDRSVDPCDDFYQFACGGWIAHTEIPADQPRWARSFNVIHKQVQEELRGILEAAAEPDADRDPTSTKLGDYYASCMDEAAIEKAGTKPIAPLLARARKVKDPRSIALLLADLHKTKIWALFDLSSAQDYGDATRMVAFLDQNGLGLPDRDYYTRDDDKSKEIRAAYQQHVQRMLGLIGMREARAKRAAADVMAIETALAKVSLTRVDRRDPKNLDHLLDRAALTRLTPHFPWELYLDRVGLGSIADANVTAPAFFQGMDALLASIKPAQWRNYLQWQIVSGAADALPERFVDEEFQMAKLLTGQPELPPRWKRCVASTDAAMGELLAQPFVAKYFAGNSKVAADQIVRAISQAMANDLDTLAWMDPETRAHARAKLHKMAYLIGYPDKWKTYDFPVDRTHYAANLHAAMVFDTERDLAEIGKPVDRNEWHMSPPTVNAYYSPPQNHMVFPAGILQPPFYKATFALPVNLGAIGMVMGHELTHGFDDQGSKFDGNGNLKDWWNPTTEKQFDAKTQCLVDQASRFEPLPGLELNGKLTLGENIADLGGLKLAFIAFHALRQGATETEVAGGFTEDQQFFLAHAQAWCTKSRDPIVRMLAQTDPHAAPKFRVNGPLSNLPEFAEAFSCPVGSKMHPEHTCAVW